MVGGPHPIGIAKRWPQQLYNLRHHLFALRALKLLEEGPAEGL
jgi:hypothetical protein